METVQWVGLSLASGTQFVVFPLVDYFIVSERGKNVITYMQNVQSWYGLSNKANWELFVAIMFLWDIS